MFPSHCTRAKHAFLVSYSYKLQECDVSTWDQDSWPRIYPGSPQLPCCWHEMTEKKYKISIIYHTGISANKTGCVILTPLLIYHNTWYFIPFTGIIIRLKHYGANMGHNMRHLSVPYIIHWHRQRVTVAFA